MPLDDSASPAEPPPWRAHVHPAADLFPMMADDELRELGRDILANGLQQPLVFWSDQLLDGRNRLAAVEIAAPPEDCARLIRLMLSGGSDPDLMVSFPPPRVLPEDDDPVAYVVSANLHRRHLTGEQKRDVIAGLLKAHPEWSDRATARLIGASPTTVGTVRHDLEQRGDVSKLDTRTDSIGREQPATKPDVLQRLQENGARKAAVRAWRSNSGADELVRLEAEMRAAALDRAVEILFEALSDDRLVELINCIKRGPGLFTERLIDAVVSRRPDLFPDDNDGGSSEPPPAAE